MDEFDKGACTLDWSRDEAITATSKSPLTSSAWPCFNREEIFGEFVPRTREGSFLVMPLIVRPQTLDILGNAIDRASSNTGHNPIQFESRGKPHRRRGRRLVNTVDVACVALSDEESRRDPGVRAICHFRRSRALTLVANVSIPYRTAVLG